MPLSASDRYVYISNLREWLEGLGLGKYAELFAENEIELGDLPHLAEADLRELGLPMGPRKRILNAVSDRSPAEVADAAPDPSGATPADYALGLVVSALVGYAAIAFLLRYLQTGTLKIFVGYRVLLGVIIIVTELIRSS